MKKQIVAFGEPFGFHFVQHDLIFYSVCNDIQHVILSRTHVRLETIKE